MKKFAVINEKTEYAVLKFEMFVFNQQSLME